MAKAAIGARYVLGLIMFVFGLNGFFGFISLPPPSAEFGAFAGALAATGYFFPMVKGVEVLVGIALLSNKFVPLALIILAPISINIFAVHAFLDPAGLPLGALVIILNVFLGYVHLDKYSAILKP